MVDLVDNKDFTSKAKEKIYPFDCVSPIPNGFISGDYFPSGLWPDRQTLGLCLEKKKKGT